MERNTFRTYRELRVHHSAFPEVSVEEMYNRQLGVGNDVHELLFICQLRQRARRLVVDHIFFSLQSVCRILHVSMLKSKLHNPSRGKERHMKKQERTLHATAAYGSPE
jgi:hypothetical protein